jgi:hydroxymethylpyrimidine/phosphomethylpyrimidine kinase
MMEQRYIPVLTIAGSDCSGGAGIQADIKTISALGCYAMSVITALTAQNTAGVTAIDGVSTDMVAAQIDAVMTDIPPLAVKTGMLYSREIVETVAAKVQQYAVTNLIVDPVMVSTSGAKLIADDAIEAYRTALFPKALMITPNVSEARHLSGTDQVKQQIDRLSTLGVRYVLLKGGDTTHTDRKTDYLIDYTTGSVATYEAIAVDTVNTHGTGCTLSSAIASMIAQGLEVAQAVDAAKRYITDALTAGAGVTIGYGHGPLNHFYKPKQLIIR